MATKRTTPPAPLGLSKLLTVEQLADYLQVPVQTVYYWRTKRTAPGARYVGRHLRFREEDVAAWLEEQETDAA